MIYLVFSFKHSQSCRELAVINYSSTLQAFLPEAYIRSEMRVWQSSNKKFLIVSWANNNISVDGKLSYASDVVIKHPIKGALIASGHAQKGLIRVQDKLVFPYIFELMKVSKASVKLSDTPGGSGTYSWVSPDEETSMSWNTQPPAFPLFVGKNHNDFCVVGNRVLSVMLASHLADKLTNLNKSYIDSYIPAGYALNGETMYENVRMLPANQSVSCQNGSWKFTNYVIDKPEVIPQELPLEEKSALLASALIKSFDVLQDFGDSLFWLSGGKDSRTLASIIENQGLKTQAVSFGSKEYDFANPVAELCGVDYQVHDMSVMTDPIAAAMISNRLTEGLGASAAHQYNFQYPAIQPGCPNIHGHGHLLRGGFARRMVANKKIVNELLINSFLSPFVSKSASEQIVEDIEKWKKTRNLADVRDELYWANHDLRLGAYTAPQVMDMSGKFFTLFPLLDEGVARIASGLFMFDKVSERVLFGAIKQLSPALSELPLFSEGWRFDRYPEETNFIDSNHNFRQGYDKRHLKPVATIDATRNDLKNIGNTTWAESLKMRHRFIVESSSYRDIKKLLPPEVVLLIENRAMGIKEKYFPSLSENDRFILNSLLNRVFIASTLYDTPWL